MSGNAEESDYLKFRGKCKEMSEALILADPTLTLVRGHYYCYQWGEQPHWWCKDRDGKVIDPTKDQFPSKGRGDYVEFDGFFHCEYCDKTVHEDEAYFVEHHVYCDSPCYARDVGF